MRILVTNDDGIEAPGVHVLAASVADLGHDVVVAAPQRDMSGYSAAIGSMHIDEHVDVEPFEIPGRPDLEAYGVDGPPALAVIAGRLGAFGEPPELIVSGINPGHNTGRATLHSGTVGAALTGANFGVSGLAISIGVAEVIHYETAGAVAAAAVEWLAGAETRTVLNINVPNMTLAEVRGVRWAKLAPFGTVRAAVVEAGEGRLQMELRATGLELPPGTDTALVLDGYVAVTSIVGIRATEEIDVAPWLEKALS